MSVKELEAIKAVEEATETYLKRLDTVSNFTVKVGFECVTGDFNVHMLEVFDEGEDNDDMYIREGINIHPRPIVTGEAKDAYIMQFKIEDMDVLRIFLASFFYYVVTVDKTISITLFTHLYNCAKETKI